MAISKSLLSPHTASAGQPMTCCWDRAESERTQHRYNLPGTFAWVSVASNHSHLQNASSLAPG